MYAYTILYCAGQLNVLLRAMYTGKGTKPSAHHLPSNSHASLNYQSIRSDWYLTIWELVWGLIRRQSTITRVTRWMIQLQMSMSTRSPKRKKNANITRIYTSPIDRSPASYHVDLDSKLHILSRRPWLIVSLLASQFHGKSPAIYHAKFLK